MTRTGPPTWSLVLPVKPLSLAKSRLEVARDAREELVLAMVRDTVAAAVACQAAAQVVVVTDDARAAAAVRAAGCVVVADRPAAGLNAALAHGAAEAARTAPVSGVALLSADLPALRAGELGAALAAASAYPLAMVADAAGTGTTLLTAWPGSPLVPRYGAGSRALHEAAGHVAVADDDITSVRQDVDTLADLAAACRLGVGPHTAEALQRLGLRLP